MNPDDLVLARRSIERLAKKDRVSPNEIRGYIQEAIKEAQNAASPEWKLLTLSMPVDRALPLPEELILCIASRLTQRREELKP